MKKSFLMGAVLLMTIFFAQSATAQISKFKSLYIYNICRYVQWPSTMNGTNFIIGVLGNDAGLSTELKSIGATKKFQGKKLQVIKLKSASEAANCNVVYIAKGQEKNIAAYGATAKNALLISEGSGAINKGSAINFYLEGNKLKFELKAANITSKGLSVSNELNALASKTY